MWTSNMIFVCSIHFPAIECYSMTRCEFYITASLQPRARRLLCFDVCQMSMTPSHILCSVAVIDCKYSPLFACSILLSLSVIWCCEPAVSCFVTDPVIKVIGMSTNCDMQRPIDIGLVCTAVDENSTEIAVQLQNIHS